MDCKKEIIEQLTKNKYVSAYCDECLEKNPARELVVSNVEQIIHVSKNVKANLIRCNICNINFTIQSPCIACELRLKEPDKYKQFMEFMK